MLKRRLARLALVLFLICLSGTALAADRPDGPVDASSSDQVPNMVPFANPDGSLDIVWQRVDGRLMYSRFSGPNWEGTTGEVSGPLDQLIGFTKDEEGRAYIVTASNARLAADDNGTLRNPDDRRPCILQLQRFPPGGLEADLTLDLNERQYYETWGVYNPVLDFTSRLAWGDGSVFAAFSHNIPDYAEARMKFIMHSTGALLAVDANGESTYAGPGGHHPMGNQAWYLDGAFVALQEGDQGILMSRFFPKPGGGWSSSGMKLVYRHLPADPGDDTIDLAEYARCGNVVDVGDRYMFVFSGSRGLGWALFSRYKEFDGGVKGATLSLVFVPKEGFEQLPDFKWPENEVGPGIEVRQLAKPTGTSNLVRPRIIDTGDGRFTVVYEQWTDKSKFEHVRALRIDNTGRVVQVSATPLKGNPRCQRNAESFRIGDECGWIAGDNANKKIMLHLLRGSADVRSIPLDLE